MVGVAGTRPIRDRARSLAGIWWRGARQAAGTGQETPEDQSPQASAAAEEDAFEPNHPIARLRAAARGVADGGRSQVMVNYCQRIRDTLDEIEKCIVRPGDPRLSQIICGNGDEATKSEGGCICQDQHRRGYCTEPGCPHAVRPSSPTADRREIVTREHPIQIAQRGFDVWACTTKSGSSASTAHQSRTIWSCASRWSSPRSTEEGDEQVRLLR